MVRFYGVCGSNLEKQRRVLPSPQCPLLGIILIVSCDVLLDSSSRSKRNCLPYILFAACPCSAVHCHNHFVSRGVTINLRHPRPHNMHRTKNNRAFHLTSFQTSKYSVDSVGFNGTLIG